MIARDSWAGHRLLLFGTDSAFSMAVFKELLLGRVNTVAVVVPGPAPVPSLLPVSVPSRTASVLSLAAERGIPVHHVRRLKEEGNIEAFKDTAPDFLLVACFPYRLPLAVRRVPEKDALNLHPSLLPRYRGPTPLFWQFRCGETNTGVTLHRLAQELDRGDIIAQKRVTQPDGIDATEADDRLAVHGAR